MTKCGIYKIENLITHHVYIGQSRNIDTRWRHHRDNIHSGKKDYPLYRAINKYGIENFSFDIIEECPKESLDEREQFWIRHYNSYKNGYNQTIGGQGAKQCGVSLDYKKVEAIKNELLTTYKTNVEIATQYNVSENIISGNNTGYYWYDDETNYPIRPRNFSQKARSLIAKSNNALTAQEIYSNEEYQQTEYFCLSCGKPITKFSKTGLCIQCASAKRRVVDRPSKEELYQLLKDNNGNFTAVGCLYKMDSNIIRKWCVGYGIPSHTKDYRPPKEEKVKQLPTQPKPVAKLDLNTGEILETYSSIEEAQRVNHVFHVGRVCSGERHSSGGFGWKFLEITP